MHKALKGVNLTVNSPVRAVRSALGAVCMNICRRDMLHPLPSKLIQNRLKDPSIAAKCNGQNEGFLLLQPRLRYIFERPVAKLRWHLSFSYFLKLRSSDVPCLRVDPGSRRSFPQAAISPAEVEEVDACRRVGPTMQPIPVFLRSLCHIRLDCRCGQELQAQTHYRERKRETRKRNGPNRGRSRFCEQGRVTVSDFVSRAGIRGKRRTATT